MLLLCNKRGYAALIVVIFIQQFQIFKTRASIGSWGSVSSSPVRQLGLTDRPTNQKMDMRFSFRDVILFLITPLN